MKHVTTTVKHFFVHLAGLTCKGQPADINGRITLKSTDEDVLCVTEHDLDNNSYKVIVIGPGLCDLVACANAGFGSDNNLVREYFNYIVTDGNNTLDRFELQQFDACYRAMER